MERRNTIQRELVLNAVRELKDHATADEVYNKIAKDYPNIGKGTVYRNLGILAEEGEIKKISLPDEPDRYDHIVTKHHHVKCVKCGRIFDVDVKMNEAPADSIIDNKGLLILDYDIIFSGICSDCQKQAE